MLSRARAQFHQTKHLGRSNESKVLMILKLPHSFIIHIKLSNSIVMAHCQVFAHAQPSNYDYDDV